MRQDYTRDGNRMRLRSLFLQLALPHPLSLCATALCLCVPPAFAQDRLQISLVPVWIYAEDAAGELRRAPEQASDEAEEMMHEALSILGVRATEYELRVAPEHQHQTLRCTQTLAGHGHPPECLHPYDQPNDWILTQDQIADLPYVMTGTRRNRASDQGNIEYFILLAPRDFAWGSTHYGMNAWWSWSGFAPEDLHWSTTSCQIWSNAWLYNVAHELGHCFGLYHGDANGGHDPNFDGEDNSMDLMSTGAHFYVTRLRPSNRNRVRHHFRSLDEELSNTRNAAPISLPSQH